MEGQRYRPPEEQAPDLPEHSQGDSDFEISKNVEPSIKSHEISADEVAVVGAINDAEARLGYTLENPDNVARVVETRQELKDNPLTPSGMTHVGEVVAAGKLVQDSAANQKTYNVADKFQPGEQTEIVNYQQHSQIKSLPSLYRIAILWGFLVALFILLLAVLFGWL